MNCLYIIKYESNILFGYFGDSASLLLTADSTCFPWSIWTSLQLKCITWSIIWKHNRKNLSWCQEQQTNNHQTKWSSWSLLWISLQVFWYTLCPQSCLRYFIHSNAGKRFLDFPDKRYCCFCCDSSHGCGITAPNWLVTANATYQGTENLDSQGPYMKWLIKGLQSNLYYHKNDTLNTPRRLNQLSDDLMDFTAYKVGISDPKIFELPSYCKDQCGLTTICAGLRNDNLQTEWNKWDI